jgi:thiol-disulfide isomerase/thioredoxin
MLPHPVRHSKALAAAKRMVADALTPSGVAATRRFFQPLVPLPASPYRHRMQNRPVVLLLASLIALSASACQRKAENNQVASTPDEPGKGVDRSHSGRPIPAANLFNADEDQATLADARGKPLLVNLWASWCAPCVKELPTLDALSRRPGAPRIVAVSEDVGERASVEAFLESHGIKDLEAWRDPKMALSGALGIEVMPTTVYYDGAGREIWRYTGDLDWSGDEAAKLLAEIGPAATH